MCVSKLVCVGGCVCVCVCASLCVCEHMTVCVCAHMCISVLLSKLSLHYCVHISTQ